MRLDRIVARNQAADRKPHVIGYAPERRADGTYRKLPVLSAPQHTHGSPWWRLRFEQLQVKRAAGRLARALGGAS